MSEPYDSYFGPEHEAYVERLKAEGKPLYGACMDHIFCSGEPDHTSTYENKSN